MESTSCDALPNIKLLANTHTQSTLNYKWTIFEMKNRKYLHRASTTSAGNSMLREEIESYKQISFSTLNYNLCKFYSPVMKYAESKDGDRIETVEQYIGMPIALLTTHIKVSGEQYFIQLLELVLRQSAILLGSNNVVHGNLSPENILYNDSTHMVLIVGGIQTKVSKCTPIKKSMYYPHRKEKPTQEEAIKEDIKALALIMYELCMEMDNGMHITLADDSFKTREGKFEITRVITLCPLLNRSKPPLRDMLNIMIEQSNIISYEAIRNTYPSEIYPHISVNNEQYKTNSVELPCHTNIMPIGNVIPSISQPTAIRPSFSQRPSSDLPTFQPTILQKCSIVNGSISTYQNTVFSCYDCKMKIKKFGEKLNFFVEQSIYGQFFIKVYQNIEEYKKEQEISKLGDQKQLLTIPRLYQKPPVKEKELAFEYGGHNIIDKVQYEKEDRCVLTNVLASAYFLINDLSIGSIFNFSITPSHFNIMPDWIPKLVNNKHCMIYDPLSSKQYVSLDHPIGIDYASPELLSIFIDGKKGEVCPLQSMIYSVGKCIVAALMSCYSRVDVLRNMYGMNIIDANSIYSSICKGLNDNDKAIIAKHGDSININDYAAAMYYSRKNEQLIKAVKCMPPINSSTSAEYHQLFIQYLCKMLSLDASERTTLPELLANAEPPYNNETTPTNSTASEEFTIKVSTHDTVSVRPKMIPKFNETSDIIKIEPLQTLVSQPIIQPQPNMVNLFSSVNSAYVLNDSNLNDDTRACYPISYYSALTKANRILRHSSTLKIINIPVLLEPSKITVAKMVRNPCISNSFKLSKQSESTIDYVPLAKFAQCFIDNCITPKLLMIGGCINGQSQKLTYKITFAGKTRLADMNIGRDRFGLASFHNYVVVAGGSFSNENSKCEILNTVELYDAKNNKWYRAEGVMKESRLLPTIVVNNGQLLVIGGLLSFDGNACSPYIDVFDIDDYSIRNVRQIRLKGDKYEGLDSSFAIAMLSQSSKLPDIVLVSNFYIGNDCISYTSWNEIIRSSVPYECKRKCFPGHDEEKIDCKSELFSDGSLLFPEYLKAILPSLQLTLLSPNCC